MRPTYLKFRSPKEETPGYTYPVLTHKGQSIGFQRPKDRTTFSRSGRWHHIEEIARRTGNNVGPGVYETNKTTNQGLSLKMMKEGFLGESKRCDYIYVGNTIVRLGGPQLRCATPQVMSRGDQSGNSPARRPMYSRASARDAHSFDQGAAEKPEIQSAYTTMNSFNQSPVVQNKRPAYGGRSYSKPRERVNNEEDQALNKKAETIDRKIVKISLSDHKAEQEDKPKEADKAAPELPVGNILDALKEEKTENNGKKVTEGGEGGKKEVDGNGDGEKKEKV